MSKVYSFRLNEENPREIQAKDVIEARLQAGYSSRQIITEALLVANNNRRDADDIFSIFEQIKKMFSKFNDDSRMNNKDDSEIPVLSSSFMDCS